MTGISRRLPPLATLVAFEAAVRHASFTRAADELALSQASISRRIRELEHDLGLKLFDRRRYDVEPTADGEAFAATVRRSLHDIASASERVRERDSGRLTIFSDISLAHTIVVPSLREFQKLHPDLQIRIIASSEAIETVGEEFDIGLQNGHWGEDKFSIEPIGDDLLFPVCAPDMAARLPASPSPVDVASMPLLHFTELGRKWPDWRMFLANYRLKEPKPHEGLTFNSYQICLDVAENNGGVALAWSRTVQPRLDAGRLVRIAGMSIKLPNAISVYRPKNTERNPVVEQFVEMIRARIEPVA